MRRIFAVALTGLVIAALTIRVSHSQTAGGSVAGPQFTADGKLAQLDQLCDSDPVKCFGISRGC